MKDATFLRKTAIKCLGYAAFFACCLYVFFLASVLLVGGSLTPSWVHYATSFIGFTQAILQLFGIGGNSLFSTVMFWTITFFLLVFSFILAKEAKKQRNINKTLKQMQ